ncbi:MAG: c-type cytochrome [bacterium]
MSELDVADSRTDEENEIQKNLKIFESRWRYAVFPAMVLFVLLIGFMFYLIYGMLQRMQDLAEDIDKMTTVMSESLPVMQGAVVAMSSRMQWVGDDLKDMSGNVNHMTRVISRSMPSMENSMNGMSSDMSNMAYATNNMSTTTHNMGQNLWNLNKNVSGPLGFMNKMLPFKEKTAPPPRPTYYSNWPQRSYYYPQQVQQSYAYGAAQQVAQSATQVSNMSAGMPAATHAMSVAEEEGKTKFAGFCASCHGAQGEGGVGPVLAGHTKDQVVATLEAYRSGATVGTMTGVAKEMSDSDINSISSFIATGQF